MRVHFSAALPCVLRLDGANAGFCGEAEKFADIEGERTLAEFLPADGNYVPLSFVLDEGFLQRPPACTDVYRYGCGADICAVRFCTREAGFTVLAQARVGGLLATAFNCGAPLLLLEGGGIFVTYPLPRGEYDVGQEQIGGDSFVRVLCRNKAGNRLLLFTAEGRRALDIRADEYECGDELCVRARLADIAGHTAERRYRLQGGALCEISRSARPREGFDPVSLPEQVLPFAFFQAMAAGGDPTPYLSDDLAGRVAELREYLGDFCGVRLPKEIFYLTYGQINAAGLLYNAAPNLFDVRFFTADLADGKIANIRPVT